MSLLCSTTCGAAAALPAALDECALDIIKTSGDRFVLIPCDYQFTDVTNVAEWEALKAAGNVVCTPRGYFSKGIPSQTNFDVACGLKVSVQDGQTFEFESSLLDPTNLSDQDFWKNIRANYKSYKVIPVLCDDQFLISDAYVSAITAAGESPGHSFSWVAPPDYEIPAGENALMKLVGSMFIPHDGIICRRYLPGVLAAICE